METNFNNFINEEKQTSPNPKTLTHLIYRIANSEGDGDFRLGNLKGSVVEKNYGYWGYFIVDFYFKKDNPRFHDNWDHFATWNQNTGGYEEGTLEMSDYEELIPVFKEAIKKAGFTRGEIKIENDMSEESQDVVQESIGQQKTATLITYWYAPGILGNNDYKGIVYVDKDNPSPDPLKKLLWGWDENGNSINGDYKRVFERTKDSPIKITYDIPKFTTAHQERELKIQAIKNYIKSL